MPTPTAVSLNHFALYQFTPAYWDRPDEERHARLERWIGAMREAAEYVHCYQTTGIEASSDLLVWSAIRSESPDVARTFFAELARAHAPMRRDIQLRETVWGFTRPSQYTKTRSTQEVEPFTDVRSPYLIAYPFVKTPEWYLLPREERQTMMMDHIKVGKQYKDITQLLLYSFGLQDQEFVVVYETDDALRFLALVEELRATPVRRYTERDNPVHLAIHQPNMEALRTWL
jgi:chlorite dismutase